MENDCNGNREPVCSDSSLPSENKAANKQSNSYRDL